ncbi:MAG: HAD family phosphatase [Clostridiales bacterium]|nr:HAD family phosphatase [Clostridiales bacterium]
MNMKAAIFDVDGTLVDSLMLWDILWADFGKKYCGGNAYSPSEADDRAIRTLPLREAMALLHAHDGIGESGEMLLEEANAVCMDFYQNRVKLKPGVKEFLEKCRENRVKMCIASATAPQLLEAALSHCGIRDYFMQLFSCGSIGKGKDQPDIFLMAQDFLGTPMEEIWVFEDSLTALSTAHKLGMKTVGIYDRLSSGQEEIQKIADRYVGPHETMMKIAEEEHG